MATTADEQSLDERFPYLLSRIEQREQTARRRALLYALVPVAVTAALLWYTAERVIEAQAEVQQASEQAAALQMQVTSYQSQVAELESALGAAQKKLSEAQERLSEATDLVQYTRPIDFVDAKSLASRFPGSERLLTKILELRERGTSWKLGGQSPAEGFDSPSFAMFILRETNAAMTETSGQPGETLLQASRRLFESLPPIASPRTGDLVFYPAGYALFYFDDRRDGPFVMGMTPFGITALKPDFAEPVGYRRVDRR